MKIYDDVLVADEYPFAVYSRVTREKLPFNYQAYPSCYPVQPVAHEHGDCFWLEQDQDANVGHFFMDTSHMILDWRPGWTILCRDVSFVRELITLWRPAAAFVPLVLDHSLHHIKRLRRPDRLFRHSLRVIPPQVLYFFMELRCKAPTVMNPVPLVMITRRGDWRRALPQEDELIEGMVKLGFVPYQFNKFSLVERISLIRQARCVFSHCGAGATHYAFIAPGATTITLYSPTLHGEEQHNSRLTRAMGGVPYVLDENGQSFSNQVNADGAAVGGDHSAPWALPSVPVILDAVKRIVDAI